MVCKECNTYNTEGTAFCRNCEEVLDPSNPYGWLYVIGAVVFVLVGIAGVISGFVCYSTYPDMPEYMLLAVLGIISIVIAFFISKKRTQNP